jgi:hypothetical protein
MSQSTRQGGRKRAAEQDRVIGMKFAEIGLGT